MKPVVVLQFAPHEGPGYFATHLSAHEVPFRLLEVDRGNPLPQADALSGLALMGGPMSVNDPLAWIPGVLALVRACVAAGRPVIGHCLGGQLLSKALGGAVSANPVKEIGWGEIDTLPVPEAAAWGVSGSFTGFHWHGETFSVPTDGVRLWTSAHCANQAFAVGPHLGMQCHIEMTEAMIEAWCRTGGAEIAESIGRSPAVQTPAAMRERLDERLCALQAVAERVYARWTAAL